MPLLVLEADGPRPVMRVGDAAVPVTAQRNFYGTVYNGWNNARRPLSFPGELWVRPGGRSTYVRRADVRGVTVRTDYRGRCKRVAEPSVPSEPIK